jgi:large subunit ribosomal protein L14
MVKTGTYLKVIDNSGAKRVFCIKVIKGYKSRYATIGDTIVVSVKSIRAKRKLSVRAKKGTLQKALIVLIKAFCKKFNGNSYKFMENSVVILNKKNKLLGTRIFGALPKILRRTKYFKLVSLSAGFMP